MSRILTFCTANIPASVRYLSLYMDYSLTIAQVISKLQQESIIPEYAFNLFTFIHTPDQQDVQVRGTPPAQDINTGFENKSDAEIRRHFHAFLAENGTKGWITTRWFAILDDKSAAQSTIVLHHGMKKSIWDEIHEEVPDTHIPGQHQVCEDDGCIWWKWRVPFRFAWSVWNSISSCDLEVLELYSRPEYLGSDGVVQAEICDQIVNGWPDPKGLV